MRNKISKFLGKAFCQSLNPRRKTGTENLSIFLARLAALSVTAVLLGVVYVMLAAAPRIGELIQESPKATSLFFVIAFLFGIVSSSIFVRAKRLLDERRIARHLQETLKRTEDRLRELLEDKMTVYSDRDLELERQMSDVIQKAVALAWDVLESAKFTGTIPDKTVEIWFSLHVCRAFGQLTKNLVANVAGEAKGSGVPSEMRPYQRRKEILQRLAIEYALEPVK